MDKLSLSPLSGYRRVFSLLDSSVASDVSNFMRVFKKETQFSNPIVERRRIRIANICIVTSSQCAAPKSVLKTFRSFQTRSPMKVRI